MFGRKAKDRITGFTGTVTGHTTYISGCSQMLLSPSVKPDGDLPTATWFDEQRIEFLDEPAVVLDNSETPGADIPAPVR